MRLLERCVLTAKTLALDLHDGLLACSDTQRRESECTSKLSEACFASQKKIVILRGVHFKSYKCDAGGWMDKWQVGPGFFRRIPRGNTDIENVMVQNELLYEEIAPLKLRAY